MPGGEGSAFQGSASFSWRFIRATSPMPTACEMPCPAGLPTSRSEVPGGNGYSSVLQPRPQFAQGLQFFLREISSFCQRCVQHGADMRIREDDTVTVWGVPCFWRDVRRVEIERREDVRHAERTGRWPLSPPEEQ